MLDALEQKIFEQKIKITLDQSISIIGCSDSSATCQ